MTEIDLKVSPPLTNDVLNKLFDAAWENYQVRDFQPILRHSLLYVCAYAGARLIGYVNVAWDGGIHAFILDTTVNPDWRRRGVGIMLVKRALDEARQRGIEWVEVDYEPHLREFYTWCGFRPTEAGLINLKRD
jgi:GNAT superfamily N-acetyltransferase